MSVSKWRYTEECNGRPCPGDCDHCSFEPADLISRADAIEAVWRAITSDELVQGSVEEEILKLPSADAVHKPDYSYEADMVRRLKESLSAEAEWIPCSERLPKRDELVLVTYKTTDRIHLCKYLDDGSENPWWSYIDDCCAWNNVVLAWMPLPKPYRKDGEA